MTKRTSKREKAPQLNTLIPELGCTSFKTSLEFYTNVLGFHVLYQRNESGFAMLEYQGSQIMIDEIKPGKRSWLAASAEPPYGRGMNLSITTDNAKELYERIQKLGAKIFLPIEDRWYRCDDLYLGCRQFIVLDPDGYLLRMTEDLGETEVPPNDPLCC